MSASNGQVIRVGRKGLKSFAFGDEGDPRGSHPFTIDVVATMNDWWDLRREFEDEEGVVPPEQRAACNAALGKFVSELSGLPLEGDNRLTLAECLEFMNVTLQQEWEKLASFFAPRPAAEPSSPPPSAPVTYCE